MKIQTQITGGAALIKPLSRTMKMSDADVELRQAVIELTQAGVRRIVLDLSRVRHMDGACLQEILRIGRSLDLVGGELSLLNPAVDDVNTIVALLRELRSFADREEACAAAPRPGRMRVLANGAGHLLDELFGGEATAMGLPA